MAPRPQLREPLVLQLVQRGACQDPDGRLMIKNLRRAELEEWCVAQGMLPHPLPGRKLSKMYFLIERVWVQSRGYNPSLDGINLVYISETHGRLWGGESG